LFGFIQGSAFASLIRSFFNIVSMQLLSPLIEFILTARILQPIIENIPLLLIIFIAFSISFFFIELKKKPLDFFYGFLCGFIFVLFVG